MGRCHRERKPWCQYDRGVPGAAEGSPKKNRPGGDDEADLGLPPPPPLPGCVSLHPRTPWRQSGQARTRARVSPMQDSQATKWLQGRAACLARATVQITQSCGCRGTSSLPSTSIGSAEAESTGGRDLVVVGGASSFQASSRDRWEGEEGGRRESRRRRRWGRGGCRMGLIQHLEAGAGLFGCRHPEIHTLLLVVSLAGHDDPVAPAAAGRRRSGSHQSERHHRAHAAQRAPVRGRRRGLELVARAGPEPVHRAASGHGHAHARDVHVVQLEARVIGAHDVQARERRQGRVAADAHAGGFLAEAVRGRASAHPDVGELHVPRELLR